MLQKALALLLFTSTAPAWVIAAEYPADLAGEQSAATAQPANEAAQVNSVVFNYADGATFSLSWTDPDTNSQLSFEATPTSNLTIKIRQPDEDKPLQYTFNATSRELTFVDLNAIGTPNTLSIRGPIDGFNNKMLEDMRYDLEAGEPLGSRLLYLNDVAVRLTVAKSPDSDQRIVAITFHGQKFTLAVDFDDPHRPAERIKLETGTNIDPTKIPDL